LLQAVELNAETIGQQGIESVLNKKEKRAAYNHLKALADQVSSLMQNLM
jgi:hypothetical protein